MYNLKYLLKYFIYVFIGYSIILLLIYIFITFLIENNNVKNVEGFDVSAYINNNRGDFYTEAEAGMINTTIYATIASKYRAMSYTFYLMPIIIGQIAGLYALTVKTDYPKSSGILDRKIDHINQEIDFNNKQLKKIDISFNFLKPSFNLNISQIKKDSNTLSVLIENTNSKIDSIYKNNTQKNMPNMLIINTNLNNCQKYLNAITYTDILDNLIIKNIRHEYFMGFDDPNYYDTRITDNNAVIVNFFKTIIFVLKPILVDLFSQITSIVLIIHNDNPEINILKDNLNKTNIKISTMITRINSINNNIHSYIELLILQDALVDQIKQNKDLIDRLNKIREFHDFDLSHMVYYNYP